MRFTKKDFRVDTFRSGGPGGQHQNKTDSGVRITHIETGLSAESREHRSQHQNKKAAFEKLAKLLIDELVKQDRRPPINETVIRTYNEKRNEVKDHRTGNTYHYGSVIDGDIEQMIQDVISCCIPSV